MNPYPPIFHMLTQTINLGKKKADAVERWAQSIAADAV